MPPPSKLAMEFGPPLESNGSIVTLLKSNEFGPPRIDVGCGFGPLWKNTIYKTQKRSMTKKKVIRNFEEIDGILEGNGEILGKTPKKRSLENFFRNLAPRL